MESPVIAPHYHMGVDLNGDALCIQDLIWRCHPKCPESVTGGAATVWSIVQWLLQPAASHVFLVARTFRSANLWAWRGYGCVPNKKSLQRAVTWRVGSQTIIKMYMSK